MVLERRTGRNRKPSLAWDGSWADLGLEGSRLSQRPLLLCLTWEPRPGSALGAGTKLKAIMAYLFTESESQALRARVKLIKRVGGEGIMPEKTDKQNRTSPKTAG